MKRKWIIVINVLILSVAVAIGAFLVFKKRDVNAEYKAPTVFKVNIQGKSSNYDYPLIFYKPISVYNAIHSIGLSARVIEMQVGKKWDEVDFDTEISNDITIKLSE